MDEVFDPNTHIVVDAIAVDGTIRREFAPASENYTPSVVYKMEAILTHSIDKIRANGIDKLYVSTIPNGTTVTIEFDPDQEGIPTTTMTEIINDGVLELTADHLGIYHLTFSCRGFTPFTKVITAV